MMILTYTSGQKHNDSAFENRLENKRTKILVSIFDKYTVLNNDIHIENIFTFNNGSHYNHDPADYNFVFYSGLNCYYKDSLCYKDSEYLKYVYNICLLLRSIKSETINMIHHMK